MENDFALTAAVTTTVPVFYDSPQAPDDAFVLPDAPQDSAPVVIADAPMEVSPDLLPSEPPSPTVYFQDYYNGLGMYLIDDHNPLVDDIPFNRGDSPSGWYQRTETGEIISLA